MQRINYLIVDDEPQARKLLQAYMAGMEHYNLVGVCGSALETFHLLQTSRVDLMFLDIKMPVISGVDLLRSLKNPPLVILTTAYPKYALEGYELSVIDYLLKPIAMPRLLQALEKASARLAEKQPVTLIQPDHLFIKAENKLVRVNLAEILLVEGMQNYVKIHLPNKVLVAAYTMKEMEQYLPQPGFLRIHRSYILPVKAINAVNGNILETDYRNLPIGTSYRATVIEQLNGG